MSLMHFLHNVSHATMSRRRRCLQRPSSFRPPPECILQLLLSILAPAHITSSSHAKMRLTMTMRMHVEHAVDKYHTALRVASVSLIIYALVITRSLVLLALASFLVTTTASWYLELLHLPRILSSIRARCLLAFLLVNFLLPAIPVVYVHLHPRTLSQATGSTSEPPAIAAIATIHTLTTTGIREKDAAVADDIRLTQLLWCKSMVAACRLQPQLAQNTTFTRTWTFNATQLLGYRDLMGTSQYAELERLGAREQGLWCDPWDYCKPSPKALEQQRGGDASSAWKQEAMLHFLNFAERLDEIQWHKIHTVSLLNSGLDLGMSVREAWVKRTISRLDEMDERRKNMQKGSRELVESGWQWCWPFAASIGTGRLMWNIVSEGTWQRAKTWILGVLVGGEWSMEPGDARLHAETQWASDDCEDFVAFQESVNIMKDMVVQDRAELDAIKDGITSLLTHSGEDFDALETWLRSVADEVVGNLTTWHVWDHASAGLNGLRREIDALSGEDARNMRWQERYLVEDSEWWKRALADGRLGT
ncbi:uncharacterized protein MYCFIDRAFT_180086 [Pseudocercospora fijiensis CIRAD86]|uniref:Uncharacterized protein n=1 Tax=Pseudocercospora fijiensis (strain CIRAD86) TaxID=383855 RepID=M3AJ57_PSEFD|nr:uncharacterized protein MYCFIDRAFT_180086 [Pseudocercospora fijiensis CIRAD86]EME77213.1 hypothetical protein MYCFIDRAFT_180086 [Pseudocercospora fijiensis CIRAD86]